MLIIICSALMGFGGAEQLRRRARLLHQAVRFTETAICSVRYSADPPDRVISAFEAENKSFFGECREMVRRGENFRSAWRSAERTSCDFSLLLQKEKALLRELGGSMGYFDRDGQLAVLESYLAALRKAEEQAEEERKQKTGLRVSCWLLCGTMAAVIII